MNLSAKFEKAIIFRFLISVTLAFLALGLFLVHRGRGPNPTEREVQHILAWSKEIDREIDSVLVRFGIDEASWKKHHVAIPNSGLYRIERRVLIQRDVVTVQLNQALKSMAERYGARAVASENLKENKVTMHVELDGYVIESIILKVIPESERSGGKRTARRI